MLAAWSFATLLVTQALLVELEEEAQYQQAPHKAEAEVVVV